MDFKTALKESLTAAEALSGNRTQIRTTLLKFCSDVLEATDYTVNIYYRSEYSKSPVDLNNALNDVVALDATSNDSPVSLYMYASGSTDSGGQHIAKFSWLPVNGYPCYIEFDGYRYVANDTDELEQSLKEMLSSPFVSQKIYNFYVAGKDK